MMDEITSQLKRAVPAVGGTVWSALTTQQWVALATGIYVVLQIAYLARKWWREEKDWRAAGIARRRR